MFDEDDELRAMFDESQCTIVFCLRSGSEVEVRERCPAWAETEARRRLGHRAASESTAGDLLLVKDEGALLLAHRHALHEEV